MSDSLTIPFLKAVRIGNFKLWRGNCTVGKGKEKTAIECVHVSDLEGSWSVRIPATASLFSTICNGYATVDEKLRDDFLGMVFTDIYMMSTSGSEALHDVFHFVNEMVNYPYLLLPEKEMRRRMKEGLKKDGFDKRKADEHIENMCRIRRELYELAERKRDRLIETYERQQEERRRYQATSEEEDMRRDGIAEEAIGILNGEEQD